MTLIALVLTASAEIGPVYSAWTDLVGSGCNLEQTHVWSPIEARVLRNTPFALQGYTFSSPELTALYTADGNWYQPAGKSVSLSAEDTACVAKLKARESELGGLFNAPEAFQKRATRDPSVFESLREWSQRSDSTNPYAKLQSYQEPDGTWHVTARYPGCTDNPELGLECGGYFIMCPAGEGPCEVGEAG